MIEKPFDASKLYNQIVHYYIDKKGLTKEQANDIAERVVKRERKDAFVKTHHVVTLILNILEMQNNVLYLNVIVKNSSRSSLNKVDIFYE